MLTDVDEVVLQNNGELAELQEMEVRDDISGAVRVGTNPLRLGRTERAVNDEQDTRPNRPSMEVFFVGNALEKQRRSSVHRTAPLAAGTIVATESHMENERGREESQVTKAEELLSYNSVTIVEPAGDILPGAAALAKSVAVCLVNNVGSNTGKEVKSENAATNPPDTRLLGRDDIVRIEPESKLDISKESLEQLAKAIKEAAKSSGIDYLKVNPGGFVQTLGAKAILPALMEVAQSKRPSAVPLTKQILVRETLEKLLGAHNKEVNAIVEKVVPSRGLQR